MKFGRRDTMHDIVVPAVVAVVVIHLSFLFLGFALRALYWIAMLGVAVFVLYAFWPSLFSRQPFVAQCLAEPVACAADVGQLVKYWVTAFQ